MSDVDVLREIERMEGWLQDCQQMPGPEGLAEWNQAFRSALMGAERSPGWAELVARAHALGTQVNDRAALLAVERDEVRADLDAQERGGRALKGYGAAAY